MGTLRPLALRFGPRLSDKYWSCLSAFSRLRGHRKLVEREQAGCSGWLMGTLRPLALRFGPRLSYNYYSGPSAFSRLLGQRKLVE